MSFLIALSLVAAPMMVQTAAAVPNYSQIIADEAYWISLAQVPTTVAGPGRGGMAWYPDSGTRKIRPYIANRGAVGMLLAGPYYYPMVQAYVDWYFRHVNGGPSSALPADYNGVSGTVYDWDVTVATGAETYGADPGSGTTPWYDSTDAYAGTFLTLLRKWAEADTSSHSYLVSKANDIDMIASASLVTLQANGLTGAKPDYAGQFLMDNVEVAAGLRDDVWLLQNVLNNPTKAAQRQGQLNTLLTAIENHLWTPGPGMYCWASDQCTNTLWTRFYSDAVSQVWPIVAGIASPTRASSLWSSFNTNWPNWTTSVNNPDGSPWAILAVAAAVRGDKTRADSYLDGSQTGWVNGGRAWPWNIADSADRATAASLASALP
ncbi:hypothetical protein [Kribbella kalugense]|uniref:hypothetical protein n=1 Tax=Kribbella kalugense TaxID=2512221 RepID=UPI0010656DBA|nr:hypothetical protein [Kribbella kalugense]